MIVFYLINHFVHFAFLADAAGAAGIAVVHSLFNIGCAVVLFPFANKLVDLAALTVHNRKEPEPERTQPEELAALDERFLDSPSFAIQLCKHAVEKMAEYTSRAILLAMEVLREYDETKEAEVIRLEQLSDRFEDAVGTYLVKLAGKDLSQEDSHLLSVLLHSISDFERISDHAISVTESALSLIHI